MALKGHRHIAEHYSEISYSMNEVTERGILVAYPSGTVASPALDDPANIARIPTAATDKVIGVLMEDVVDVDLTKYGLNCHKCETQVGSKVHIMTGGVFNTNMIATGITPAVGADAFLAVGGLFSDAGTEKVGTFESSVGADGYARIRLHIG